MSFSTAIPASRSSANSSMAACDTIRRLNTLITALGAAYLAGLAVGFWSNIDSIATHWRVDKTFNPMMQRGRVAEIRERWSEALGRAKNWEPHSPSECTNHPIKPT